MEIPVVALGCRWRNPAVSVRGAQGEVFHMKFLQIIKVFKAGSSLKDLQKQWPQGMLLKIMASERRFYHGGGCSIGMGMMFDDGRFAFAMQRHWGDLRKVIDLRMQHNGNRLPPFELATALYAIHGIAWGMRGLHRDNIVHRDLKTLNVLVRPETWDVDDPPEELNP